MSLRIAAQRASWTKPITNSCDGCRMQSACRLAGLLPTADEDGQGIAGRRLKLANGEKLYLRNTPFKALFQVCSGALKTQRETVDGDLVVTGFFLPGDIVGVEAIADRQFPNDAIATKDCEVCELHFDDLLSGAVESAKLTGWLMTKMSSYAQRKDKDLSWPCSRPAHYRVLRFFLDLSERLGQASPLYEVTCDLPMRKQDIARYLHMSPETLSRNLAALRQDGLLLLDHRTFTLPDASRAYRATRI